MFLTIRERLALGMIMAKVQSNVIDLRIIRDLARDLSFNEEEQEELEITINTEIGKINWPPERDAETRDIQIGKRGMRVIKAQLEKLSSNGQLTLEQLALYERFFPNEDDEDDAGSEDPGPSTGGCLMPKN